MTKDFSASSPLLTFLVRHYIHLPQTLLSLHSHTCVCFPTKSAGCDSRRLRFAQLDKIRRRAGCEWLHGEGTADGLPVQLVTSCHKATATQNTASFPESCTTELETIVQIAFLLM